MSDKTASRRIGGAAMALAGSSAFASVLCCTAAFAQPASTSVRTEVVAQQSGPSFLESIVAGPDGSLYVTDFRSRQLLRYVDGKGFAVHARLDVHPWGLAVDDDGILYFGATEQDIVDKRSPPAQWVYRQRPGEVPALLATLPQARALNGMTWLAPGRLLIADGRGGVIWHLDVASAKATRYLADELLDVPAGFTLPTPAANGLKIHQGHLYMSNTARGAMLRQRIGPDLTPEGPVEVFAEPVRADDFAFSPAGNLYYTTHRKEIMRITPDRKVSEVPNIGPELIGNTALVWRAGDAAPFAINDGGFIAYYWYGGPLPGFSNLVRITGLEEARP